MLKLQLWDTAGQERYGALAPLFYRNANIVLLVYSAVDEESLIKCEKWFLEVTESIMNKSPSEQKTMPIMLLVENKCDLKTSVNSEVLVKMQEALKRFKSARADFVFEHIQCSALSREGIAKVFETIINMVKEAYIEWNGNLPSNNQRSASKATVSSWNCSLQ